MGRKGSWFSSIKKTLSPSSKENKIQKLEKKGFVEGNLSVPGSSIVENGSVSHQLPEEVRPIEVEDEPPTNAYSVAAATPTTPYSGKGMEEVAAVRIQTAFRGYSARRALWALRGLVRLKTVVEGPSVKQQTANTLNYTQNVSHLQSQINSRKTRMLEENQALQRQLLRAKEIANLQKGDEWKDSVQSKEEMEAKVLSKYEATMRRERAMAYSFSHQQPWKKPAGTTNMLFMDPTNPQWGWSWSMAARPWEPPPPAKNGITITRSEIAKSYARHQLNPSTPRSKADGGPVASRKSKPGSSPRNFVSGIEANADDDSKSVVKVQSERNRRHSIEGSMVRNDESLDSSPAVLNYVKSAKVKPRRQGLSENGGGGITVGTGGSAKKRISFPASPAARARPPKIEASVCNGLEQAVVE